ncbi:nuclear transport factor 2 family protein [Nocardia alni]|uniref:nuclear transport factor 2 family protein n=1 Tax=Nocardia alni TaxID=2815723 RepID=UPI001C2355D8|nr:nuclear transport factor 2 family protein [Nocardia alni]
METLLRQTADRLAIMEAKAAYCRYSDYLDVEGMLSVFTADCEFRYGPGEDVIVGIDAIREWYPLRPLRGAVGAHGRGLEAGASGIPSHRRDRNHGSPWS